MVVMSEPKFTFTMALPSSLVKHLVYGKLTYRSADGAGITFEATSGAPGHQHVGAWVKPGRGCLPPTRITGNYHVSTQGLWMPNVVGVGGNFYPISPFMVDLGVVKRGDFGIHLDSNFPNSPGSAGCIVLRNQSHWGMVQNVMKRLHDERIKAVDLEVIYT